MSNLSIPLSFCQSLCPTAYMYVVYSHRINFIQLSLGVDFTREGNRDTYYRMGLEWRKRGTMDWLNAFNETKTTDG